MFMKTSSFPGMFRIAGTWTSARGGGEGLGIYFWFGTEGVASV